MPGTTEGGLFAPTMPFPSLGTPSMGKPSTRSSGGETAGKLDFDNLFKERGTVDRNVSGTNQKTAEYHAQLAQYDNMVTAVTAGNLALLHNKHGGNVGSYMATDFQSMAEDLMTINTMKADLNYKAAIIKKENEIIAKNKFEGTDNPVMYDMNGRPMTYEGGDGSERRWTVKDYYAAMNRVGFEYDNGQPVMIESYTAPNSAAYDAIMSKMNSIVGQTGIYAGDKEGMTVLNEDQYRMAYSQALDEVMAEPEARRYFLRNYYDDQDEGSYRNYGDDELFSQREALSKKVDELSSTLDGLTGLKKTRAEMQVAYYKDQIKAVDKEDNRREAKSLGSWTDADEMNALNENLYDYKRSWVQRHSSMAASRYINNLTEKDNDKKHVKKKIADAQTGNMALQGPGSGIMIPFKTSDVVTDDALLFHNIEDIIDEDAFLQKDGTKVAQFLNNHNPKDGEPFRYKARGDQSEKDWFIDVTLGAERSIAPVAGVSVKTGVRDADMYSLVQKDSKGTITKRIFVPIQEIILMDKENFKVDEYLQENQFLRGSAIGSTIKKGFKQTMGKAAVFYPYDDKTQSETAAGQGMEARAGDFNIVNIVPNADGEFSTPLPFDGTILKLNGVYKDVAAFASEGYNPIGRAQGLRMVVNAKQLEGKGYTDREGNFISYEKQYEKNRISNKEVSTNYSVMSPDDPIFIKFLSTLSKGMADQLKAMDDFYIIDVVADYPQSLNFYEKETEYQPNEGAGFITKRSFKND
jgi:hypothetical protein